MENFKSRVHLKVSFDDNTRMERLISVLDGEVKKAVLSIGATGISYASALKALKRDFGNPVVVFYFKLINVLDLPQIPPRDRTSLRRYQQLLNSNNTWLISMGYKSAINSTENLAKAVARLPHHFRNQFHKFSKDKIASENSINLIDFEKWLSWKLLEQFNLIANLIADQEQNKIKNGKESKRDEKRVRTFATGAGSEHSTKCWICSENHFVFKCREFELKPVADRRKFVLEKGLSFNCLSPSHKVKECKSKKRCREDKCGKRHHTLLHLGPPQQNENKVSKNESEARTTRSRTTTDTYLQVIPVTLTHNNKSVTTNAILDSGSDSTLICEETARKLGLGGKEQPLRISTILSNSETFTSKIVSFNVHPTNLKEEIRIEKAWVVPDLNTPTKKRNITDLKEKYAHLKDIDISTLNDDRVTVLIGIDTPSLHIQHDYRVGKHNEPVAVKTQLGWILFGGKNKNIFTNINRLETDTDDLNKAVERFWEIESYGTKSPLHPHLLTKDEKHALHILKSTTKMKDGHFEVGLLWKDEKLDAAAKYKGISLNDNLLPGPDVLNNLVSVLLTFRTNRYAIMTDIENMFHQVKVSRIEQDALRFVWREKTGDNIDDFAMQVHLIDKVDSPCCANYALRQTSIDHDRAIVDAITKRFYMDDYLDCMKTVDEAVSIAKTVTEALKSCGFRLTKWLSNSCEILSVFQIPKP